MPGSKQDRVWEKFYQITSTRDVHVILKVALSLSGKTPGIAYDMGAGAGVDTEHLLKLGWAVHAVDQEESALEYIKARLPSAPKLFLLRSSFEDLKVKKCDLILGASSFPFCRPEHFKKFWGGMIKALEPDGIICGNFFGPNDTWAFREDMTIQNEESLLELFTGLDILYFDELEEDRATVTGTMKHWHVYSFVLKKRGPSSGPPETSY